MHDVLVLSTNSLALTERVVSLAAPGPTRRLLTYRNACCPVLVSSYSQIRQDHGIAVRQRRILPPSLACLTLALRLGRLTRHQNHRTRLPETLSNFTPHRPLQVVFGPMHDDCRIPADKLSGKWTWPQNRFPASQASLLPFELVSNATKENPPSVNHSCSCDISNSPGTSPVATSTHLYCAKPHRYTTIVYIDTHPSPVSSHDPSSITQTNQIQTLFKTFASLYGLSSQQCLDLFQRRTPQ